MSHPSSPPTPLAAASPAPASPVSWPDAARQAAFEQWLAPLVQSHQLLPASLRPASADASFRRYLRIDSAAGASCIVMDAPPDKENCRPFVQVQALMVGTMGLVHLAWAAMWWLVHEPAAPAAAGSGPRPSPLAALRELLGLFALPHTLGLVAYAAVAYAGFITLRGLWLGPLLVERHGFSLVASGNVALAMTLASMASPALFGRIDPGGARRVRWLLGFAVLAALMVGTMGLVHVAWADVALAIAYGLLSGYGVLQYGYVRDAYPAHLRGRALSLFTMAMFLGISLMQWASGLAASLAPRAGVEPFSAALLTMSALLLAGALAFWRLPRAVTPA